MRAKVGLCSGEVRLYSGWNIVGQGGECCINSIGISGHPIFSPVFQSSNKLFVADSTLQSPHHILVGQKIPQLSNFLADTWTVQQVVEELHTLKGRRRAKYQGVHCLLC